MSFKKFALYQKKRNEWYCEGIHLIGFENIVNDFLYSIKPYRYSLIYFTSFFSGFENTDLQISQMDKLELSMDKHSYKATYICGDEYVLGSWVNKFLKNTNANTIAFGVIGINDISYSSYIGRYSPFYFDLKTKSLHEKHLKLDLYNIDKCKYYLSDDSKKLLGTFLKSYPTISKKEKKILTIFYSKKSINIEDLKDFIISHKTSRYASQYELFLKPQNKEQQ